MWMIVLSNNAERLEMGLVREVISTCPVRNWCKNRSLWVVAWETVLLTRVKSLLKTKSVLYSTYSNTVLKEIKSPNGRLSCAFLRVQHQSVDERVTDCEA